MKEQKKIGLCIAYTGTSYGQLLQAYATQQIIRKKGFQTEIIKYHSGNNKGVKWSYGALIVALKHIISIIKKRIMKPAVSREDTLHKKNSFMREEMADQFRQHRLKDMVQCNGIDELRNKSKEYFAVLVGSDQVWQPDVAVSNFYTLRFAAPGVRRISYATSLGVSAYPNYVKNSARDFWRQIDYLSVREQKGKEIIQSIIDIPVEVVADPTFLFTKEEWKTLIPNEKIVEEGYILCYFLGDSEPMKKYARKLADKKGLRLVSILSNECCSDDNQYADEVLIGKSVEDFVNLIRNADFVLTDSFHGLAFSVINQKQFLAFYRKRIGKQSRNSRIDNILHMLGIEDRLVREPDEANIILEQIDYNKVSVKVDELRTGSFDFLNRALLD